MLCAPFGDLDTFQRLFDEYRVENSPDPVSCRGESTLNRRSHARGNCGLLDRCDQGRRSEKVVASRLKMADGRLNGEAPSALMLGFLLSGIFQCTRLG
jgi:hypothetical protein